jgi:hypothetical protein
MIDVFKQINDIFDAAAPQAAGRIRRMPTGILQLLRRSTPRTR